MTAQSLLAYWWVLIPILVILLHKRILRVLFGMIIIPEDKIGLVTKKFVLVGNKSLPDGRIIASNGEAGYQIDPLPPGLHWAKWIWQYKIELQGFIAVGKGKIGLISAKDGAQLPNGHILAPSVECDNYQDSRAFMKNGGQKGKQTKYLNTGVYRINTLLFEVTLADVTAIEDGQVGVITTLDGVPLQDGQIAGKPVDGHNNFQNFEKFLENGGQKGLQTQFILAGSYTINPWAVKLETVPMTEIPIGNVGIIISYVGDEGEDVTGSDFKHGNIVKRGQKGVWDTPLDPGKYPINPQTTKMQIVPTTNLVLNWATGRSEAHNLDKNLSTITVRSKDGFTFNLDVSQIIHIPSTEAPKVIARFGSIQNLVSQVLEPLIGNYFRNSAQNSDVIAFLGTRQERQADAKEMIGRVVEQYNVHAVDTLIGDITPPSDLMKTLTDRKIAQEQKLTYTIECEAQNERKNLEAAKSLSDIQIKMVTAQQSVEIAQREAESIVKKSEGDAKAKILLAEADAKQIMLLGDAEASKIEAIGKATAQSFTLQVEAMGSTQFGNLKIIEKIAEGKIKIIPEIIFNGDGNNSNPITGLLGFELLKKIKDGNKEVL